MKLLDPGDQAGFAPVPAIVRAVAVLDYVASKNLPVRLSSLSKDLGLPKSSTLGICRTLVAEGLLSQDSRREYSIGIRVVRLAGRHLAGLDLAQVFHRMLDSRPPLQNTLQLAVLDGSHVVYLARREPANGLRLPSTTGRALPASTTSVGKALLAHVDSDRIRSLYPTDDDLPRSTPRSKSTLPDLIEELRLTRERGYSIDRSETVHGVLAVGAPIFSLGDSSPVGAVSLAAADEGAVEAGQLETMGAEVLNIARDISALLGG
ncbi:MAG: IclR family transcriptional regulator [Microcella sp.]|uniref:IclR family transcriptional regulator n=1 Tax=Microcella sp. TaxID=1913979 RepID=UPI003315FE3D